MSRRPHRDHPTGSLRTGYLAVSILAHAMIMAAFAITPQFPARETPIAGQPTDFVIHEMAEPSSEIDVHQPGASPSPSFTPTLTEPIAEPVQIESLPAPEPIALWANNTTQPSTVPATIGTSIQSPAVRQPTAIVSLPSSWLKSTFPSATSIPSQSASPIRHQNEVPSYPRLARERGWQGTTWLRIEVKTDGSAGRVEILKTSGYPLLDETSMRSVRAWRFNPAIRNKQAVVSWVEVPIRFELISG